MSSAAAAPAVEADDDPVFAFDLGRVTRRLARKGVPNAHHLEREFRRFVWLIKTHPRTSLAPSPTLDVYWHEAILDTETYTRYTTACLGKYLHHIPDDAGTGMWDEYNLTIELYEQAFGKPDPDIWLPSDGVGGNSMSPSCRDGPI